MVDALIRWSLHNRAVVMALAVLFTAAGLYTVTVIPVDVFPDLTAPTVTVMTEAPGMAPTEVESLVTFPVETALNGAAGVRRVRSASVVGLSVVWVEFEWGQDINLARQIVTEKVATVSNELPPEVGRPVLAPITSIMGEVMYISLSSDTHDPIEVRTVADTLLRRRLLAVPGVAQVTPIGGDEKQFQVILEPDKLARYGLTVAQVCDALRQSNKNVSAGFLTHQSMEYLVTGIGRLTTLEEIAQTPVASRGGTPVRVSDLGEARIGGAPKRGEGSAFAKPAVILGIQKQPKANTLELTHALDAVLDELQAGLPGGMRIDRHLFRQADFISLAVRNVEMAIRDGALFVVVVMLAFLANLRATLITLTALPLSLLATVIGIHAFGGTLNTMTLGGMAIAIGALVDDAVIDVENIVRRLRENATVPPQARKPLLTVVYDASVEIRSSIVFATFIIGLVFLPIFFLSGVEGRLLRPLSTAYLIALFASLLVAVTVTPVLCHLLLPSHRSIRGAREPRFAHSLKRWYSVALDPILNHPWRSTVPIVILFIAACVSTQYMGRSFLPDFNEGALNVVAVTMPGTSLAESDTMGRLVERALLEFPEVKAVARKTGRAELDEHAQGVEGAEIEVSLRMAERSKDEMLAAMREALARIPGVVCTIGQPISHRIDHMLSGSRASVAVKVFGEDLYKLRSIAEEVRRAMSEVPGVVDLSVEQQVDIPLIHTRFDRDAVARYGLTMPEVARALEAGLQGLVVSQVFEGRNAFDLAVRLNSGEGLAPETLRELEVDTHGGGRVPLGALADIQRTTGPNVVSREQVRRKIVVMCNTAGRDVASVVEDCRRRIAPILADEPGYSVEYAGQFESAAAAGRLLMLAGFGAVLGIAFLLHLAFGSGRDAAFVMLNLPLALIGGVVGVFLTGGVLSVASLIGFITVFGIAARNGIMLVSHIRHLQASESVAGFREAVHRGAVERIVPILMTALATGLALAPLALSGDKPGNEIQTPMAMVIIFGLSTSMILNMVIVPALYLRFGRPIGDGKQED